MDGLVTFFYDDRKVVSDDPLKEVVQDYFQGEVVSETLLFRCVDQLKHHSEGFYPSLCSLLFLRKFAAIQNEKLDFEFNVLIDRGKRELFGKSLPLQRGYLALAWFLFTGGKTEMFDFKQLEKGSVLSRKPSPSLLENAELGLLACYLGKEWREEELMGKGVKICEFFKLLTSHDGTLFPGLWIPEEGYQKVLLQTIDLLIHPDAQIEIPFLRLMKEAFGGDLYPSPKCQRLLMDRSLGFLKYEWNDFSLVSSLAGNKTGLASMQKKGISIVSMGPHFIPLADSDSYGIFRPSNGSQEGFKDLSIECVEGKGKIEGWTRMISADEGGISQSWLYAQLVAKEAVLNLTIRKSHETEKELYFVFFVAADLAQLNEGAHFFPKALSRFEGATQKVLFEKEGDFLEIIPDFKGEMKLIPLAGGTHFWSANFLVAFSIPKKLAAYSWTVK